MISEFVIPNSLPYYCLMSAPQSSPFKSKFTENLATITVVSVVYIVAFAVYLAELRTPAGPPFSLITLVVATLLGILYVALMLSGNSWLEPIFGKWAKTIGFTLLVALVLTIEFLLSGSFVVWLLSMPLIAAATTELAPWPRALVYLATLFGVAGPYYRHTGDWVGTILNTLTFITAFVFVIVYVRLNDAAEKTKSEAEQLAAQLADANRRLGDYAVQAEELATIQERNRLAREIHDNLGHYLTVVNVQINAARALIGVDTDRADAALDKAGRLTQEGLAAIRQSIAALRESPLGRRSLPDAVAALAAETQAAGIVAELRVNGAPRPLDSRRELTLYRAAQEGLTNVRKHARASRVDLTLDYRDPQQVSLQICDNGIGLTNSETLPGFGLLGLEERARQLGGHVTTQSAAGQGYCLTVTLLTNTSEPESLAAGMSEHDPAIIS
jgi:signal transduction histidine kinase